MINSRSAASVALLIVAGAAPAAAQSMGDWSGAYGGVFGGVSQTDGDDDETLVFDRDFDGDFDDTVILSGSGLNAFSPGSCGGQAASNFSSDCKDDDDGVEGGVRLGYDWQFGGFVVGLVGEVAAVQAEDNVSSFSTTPASYTFSRELEQTAAIRARIGYGMGPALGYITGGPAYGKIDNRFSTSNSANSFTEQSDEDNADGYQAGVGLEWRLAPSLTFVTEYMYTSLETGDYVVRAGNNGTTGATNPFILAPNTVGTDIARGSSEFNLHAVRIGMNVQF